MAAVDLARVAAGQTLAHQVRQQGALFEPYLVRERVRLVWRNLQRVRDGTRDLGWDVLDERPAAGDVQDLNPAADREEGQVPIAGRLHEAKLELVAARLRFDDRGMRRLAVPLGRHVVAARQHEPVDARERVVDRHGCVDNPHLASDVEDRLLVILQLPARGNSDQGHVGVALLRLKGHGGRLRTPSKGSGVAVLCGDQPVQWCYIRVGTSIPIKSSARVSCAR